MDLDLPQRAVPDRVSVTEATLQLAWDDALLPRVNGEVFEPGSQDAFRARWVPMRLRASANVVTLKLSDRRGSNHGGWAFVLRAEAADGTVLRPRAG